MKIANLINMYQLQIAVGAVVFILIVSWFISGRQSGKHISTCLSAIWMVAIIYKTLWVRTSGQHCNVCLIPFASYYQAILGDSGIVDQILLNILLFVPLGCFLRLGRLPVWVGVLLTIGIEACQGIYHLGYCEMDDIISNTIGTVIGFTYCSFIASRRANDA